MGAFGALGTILIVDDDAATRSSLAAWLGNGAWHVCTATGCEEAISVAHSASPVHLIVEQCLPDGSGLDLFSRLSVICPGVSGVVLTRYPSVAAAVHAVHLGFRDYLPKPVQRAHLAHLFALPPPSPVDPNRHVQNPDDSTSLARIEWEHIHSMLFACGGNLSQAARRLRIPRRSLQRKLRRVAPP